MVELQFHPAVYEEIQAAYSWYEQQVSGLGDDFVNELEAAFESIKLRQEIRIHIHALVQDPDDLGGSFC